MNNEKRSNAVLLEAATTFITRHEFKTPAGLRFVDGALDKLRGALGDDDSSTISYGKGYQSLIIERVDTPETIKGGGFRIADDLVEPIPVSETIDNPVYGVKPCL